MLGAGDPREIPFGAAREALDVQGALCVEPEPERARRARPAAEPGATGPGAKRGIEGAGRSPSAVRPSTPTRPSTTRSGRRSRPPSRPGPALETGRRVLEAVAVEPAEGEALRAFANRVRERAGGALPGLAEER